VQAGKSPGLPAFCKGRKCGQSPASFTRRKGKAVKKFAAPLPIALLPVFALALSGCTLCRVRANEPEMRYFACHCQ
jgi:hypothetical protein